MDSDSTPMASGPANQESGGPPGTHRMSRVFFGSGGLRAGWRLLLGILFIALFSAGVGLALHFIPAVRGLRQAEMGGVLTPGILILTEGLQGLAVVLAALVMTRIDKHPFVEYGMPSALAFGKRFWQGWLFGFAMVSALLGWIAALHGFSIRGLALSGVAIPRYGLLYLLGFILVGIFEEFTFRGYLQATLASGIGFWPSAVVWALAFAGGHLRNPGEARLGALMTAVFALLAVLTLRRTGNLWFAIGMHAAWDWGETFFYSVPDSGIGAKGQLMHSAFHGPVWLTGGTVGPEGSWLVFVILALSAVAVHFLFRSRRREAV